MEITKRNGTTEPYDREKIAVAIRKSFASTGQEVSNEIIYSVVEEVENFVGKDTANRSVEQIQDKVEQSLMEHGFYAEAKNYILYRWQRTERRKALNSIINELGDGTVMDVLKEIQKGVYRGPSTQFPTIEETGKAGGIGRHPFVLRQTALSDGRRTIR